jgi:hypothetical protein
MMARMSAIHPLRWTGMMPLVLGVMAAAAFATSMLKSCPTSTSTGVSPAFTIAEHDATKVCAGTMTSSPGFRPDARSERWSAS